MRRLAHLRPFWWQGGEMFSAAFGAVLVYAVLASGFAQTERQDITTQLVKLTTLTDNNQYREAINGYMALEAQPGTPAWLKGGCAYELAEIHSALQETDVALTALARAVQLGFDDCLTPRASEHLKAVLRVPMAAQTLAAMKITEADFRELVWLMTEVQHARHEGRMMILENTNRLDHEATVIPQAQLPTRPTTSAGVMYWRQLLLVRQRMQREFVMRADILRMRHAATMGAITGVSSSTSAESARRARAVAESRRLEIHRRAFNPVIPLSDRPRSCSELNPASPIAPSR